MAYLFPAGCCSMQLQFLHERRRIPSVPTSEPTEACPPSICRAACGCTTSGLPGRSPGGDLPTITVSNAGNACGLDPQRLFPKGSPTEAGSARRTVFPSWVHDVPQECRRALGTRLTRSIINALDERDTAPWRGIRNCRNECGDRGILKIWIMETAGKPTHSPSDVYIGE